MGLLINDIATLRKTVKVSATLPFEVVEPFIRSARDLFLSRYLGIELIEVLEQEPVTDRAMEVRDLVRRSLGPLAIWIGSAELSVRIGDSGMTVEKSQDKFLPASDSKITNVSESMELRGFQYLDLALEYLEQNKDKFPEWTESRYFTLRAGNYIRSASQFQELGLVDIGNSRLTFETFRPLMSQIEERFITEMLGDELDSSLRSKLDGQQTTTEVMLIAAVRKFVACKTAELYSNQQSITPKEYKPLIRPIYSQPAGAGNIYCEQAAYYLAKVQQALAKHAESLGKEPFSPALEWNNEDRKLFNAMG